MSKYDQIANIMLGKSNENCAQNIVDNYYNAYNVPEAVLIKRRALRNYDINIPVVNDFYKNPFLEMKDKRISYISVPNRINIKYMIIENINDGSLDVYRKCNNNWALTHHISDKNNCEELLNVIK